MQTANEYGVDPTTPPFDPAQLFYSKMGNQLPKQLVLTGSLQIVFGGLTIIFQIISTAFGVGSIIGGYIVVQYVFGIGFLFITSGVLGVISGKTKRRCPVIAFNVLSVISASVTALLFCLAVSYAVIYAFVFNGYRYYYYAELNSVVVAMYSLMAIAAVAEAIVAIWSSVVCCKIGACCCGAGSCCCCPPDAEDANGQFSANLASKDLSSKFKE